MSSSKQEKQRGRGYLREALYATLEAAVREEYCGTCSRALSNGCGCYRDERQGDDSDRTMTAEKYPFPLLWFEEITPADLDSYHSSHRPAGQDLSSRRIGRINVDDAPREEAVPSLAIDRPASSQSMNASDDETTAGFEWCGVRQFDMDATVVAREGDIKRGEHEGEGATTSASPSQLAYSAGHDRFNSTNIRSNEDARNEEIDMTVPPPNSVVAPVIAREPNRHEAEYLVWWGSQTVTAMSAVVAPVTAPTRPIKRSTPVATDNTFRGTRSALTSSSTQPLGWSSCSKLAVSAGLTPATPHTEPAQQNSRSTDSPHRPVSPSLTKQPDVKSPTSGLFSTHNNSAEATFVTASAAVADTDNVRKEMTTVKPTRNEDFIALSQPALSQATQESALFMPGLPSQILVTQQGNDVNDLSCSWEGDDMEEDGTPQSEYALSASPRLTCPRYAGPTHSDFGHGRPSLPQTAAPRQGGARASVDGDTTRNDSGQLSDGRDTEEQLESSRCGRQARALDHEALTQALTKTFGEDKNGEGDAQANAKNRSDYTAGSEFRETQAFLQPNDGRSRRHKKERMVMVPASEALPSAFQGGQAGAVALLEKELDRVRGKGIPEGYAARALELACHVLRQPTVCLKMGGESDRSRSTMGSVWQTGTPAVVSHPDVIGISGFVWDILRAGDKRSRAQLRELSYGASTRM